MYVEVSDVKKRQNFVKVSSNFFSQKPGMAKQIRGPRLQCCSTPILQMDHVVCIPPALVLHDSADADDRIG